jgi:hypothetical protein
MGWFYLDDPQGRDIVAHWKERPGMVGLRFYTNDRHPQSWYESSARASKISRILMLSASH